MKQLIIIGGGASGFFLASNIKSKNWKVSILEQAKLPLQKVRVSGGGRCNLTHACFIPRELVKFYPRGNRELMSVFSKFQPSETFDWFEKRGVELKIEDDNRVFPASNSSLTIIETLLSEAEKNNTEIRHETTVTNISQKENKFILETNQGELIADAIVIASGASPKMWDMVKDLGHSIIKPVPSLFTFNSTHPIIKDLPGTTFAEAEVSIPSLKLKEFGPLLITHWGISGPSILRLSAWGARELADIDYKFNLRVNWISEKTEYVIEDLLEAKTSSPRKSIYSLKPYSLTKKFWENLLQILNINDCLLADITKKDLVKIAEALTNTQLPIEGKSTFKDEFVTAGGVNLKEIDFKAMQSKLVPNLYFSGEVLDIDAITGGFNFQACWSEAYVISQQFQD